MHINFVGTTGRNIEKRGVWSSPILGKYAWTRCGKCVTRHHSTRLFLQVYISVLLCNNITLYILTAAVFWKPLNVRLQVRYVESVVVEHGTLLASKYGKNCVRKYYADNSSQSFYLPKVRCARWTIVRRTTPNSDPFPSTVLSSVRRRRVGTVPVTLFHASATRPRTLAITVT